MAQTMIIAVGGFPGSGKSSISDRLARDLRLPLLGSDLLGNTIKGVLADHGADPSIVSLGFRAGYLSLFALAEEFARHGCSVVVDMSLGWQFQWDALDTISRRLEEVEIRPIILTCSLGTCWERLEQRHLKDPEQHPPAPDFMAQPQLDGVGRFLQTLNRPDAIEIDADGPISDVYKDVCLALTDLIPDWPDRNPT